MLASRQRLQPCLHTLFVAKPRADSNQPIHSSKKDRYEKEIFYIRDTFLWNELRQALCLRADNGFCLACALYSRHSREADSNQPIHSSKKDRYKTCLFYWRRIRDSNSGTLLQVTRFPIVRPRPTRRILRIYFLMLNKYIISFSKNQEFFKFCF